MPVIDSIAAWWGVSVAMAGYLVGFILLALVIIGLALITDSSMVFMVTGMSFVVFLILLGLWPTWVILPLILAFALMLMFGKDFGAGRGD